MACAALGGGSLGAYLALPKRWEVTLATTAGGLLGIALSSGVMRARARRQGRPLVSRRLDAFAAYSRTLPIWRFVLMFVVPLNLAIGVLVEQCFQGKPFWSFPEHGYSNLAHGMFSMVLYAIIGRWFMSHAMKGRDDLGMETTKGRIAPAPRVK